MRLLDTDTCVELLRGNPHVIARRAGVQDKVVTTWINVAELYFGAARSEAPGENHALVNELLESLEVVGIDRESAQIFGKSKAEFQKSGKPLPDADLFIGCIALAREAIVVTGNIRHFSQFHGIRLENWIR